MTHSVRSPFGPALISILVAGLVAGLPAARAGLEFTDSAPVDKGKSPETVTETLTETETVTETTREAPESSDPASDYAEMLEADRREFETLRNQSRTRRTSAAEGSEPAAAPARKTTGAKSGSKTSALKPSRVAKPAMQTETITPQGSAPGTSRRSGKAVSATEEIPSAPTETNVAFGYTHLLPNPFNLPQGTLILGTTIAYGVFDFFQVSTNVARTLNEHWNFQAKVPLIEFPTFMTTAFVDYENYNPRNISDLNPDMRYARWQPGLTTAYELSSDMALFLGGNFSFGKDPVPVVRKSGYLKGARIEIDWSWVYNPASSRLADNALSTGVTYDLTYELFGLGLTHHWRNFSLGLHYTFADTSRFLPIVGFQAAASF